MAVAYSNQTTATATSGTSLSISAPTGIASGDLLILSVNGGSGQSAFASSGWTSLIATYTDSNDTAGAIFYKIATGSEPASYTVSWTTATADCIATIRHFTGNDTTTPIRTSRIDHKGATGASFATTAATGAQTGDLTIQVAQMGDDSGSTTFTVTQPGSPWTSIDSVTTVRPKYQGAVRAAGAQSGATWTSSSASAYWNVATIVIATASGGGGGGTTPALVATALGNNNMTVTSDTVTITIPSGAAVGQVAVLSLGCTMTTATLISVPTGWNLQSGPDAGNANNASWLYTHTLQSGDPGTTVSFQADNSGRFVGLMEVWSGVTETGLVSAANVGQASSTIDVFPSLASVPANAALIAMTNRRRGGTPAASETTPPTGYTNDATVKTTIGATPEFSIIGLHTLATTAGTYGGDSNTVSSASVGTDYLIALPAVASSTDYTASPADTVGITDAVTVNVNYVLGPADNEPITDAIVTARTVFQSPPTDAVGLTDSVSVGRFAAPADTVGITDSAAGGALQNPAESVGLTDATAKVQTQFPAVADSVGLTDIATPLQSFNRSTTSADTVGLTDAVSFVQTKALTVADAVGITDVGGGGAVFNITPADTVGATDATTKIQTQQQTVPDTVGLTDTAVAGRIQLVSAADTLGITDAPGIGRFAAPADTVGITDASTRVTGTGITVADTVGITDTATHGEADVKADNIGITDAVTSAYVHGGFAADTLGLTDAVTIKQVNVRTAADTLGITDAEAIYGVFALLTATTADTDVDSSTGMQDVARLQANVLLDFNVTTADLELGPQRAVIDFEANTSDLTRVIALSGQGDASFGAGSRLDVVHRMTDIVSTQLVGVVQPMTLKNGPIYSATRVNLTTDPSFESGLGGAAAQTATIAQTTTWADTGTHSLAITATGTGGTPTDSAADFGSGTAYAFGMAPGQTYTVSATIHVPAALRGALDGRACSIVIYGLTSAFGVVSSIQSPKGPTAGGTARVSVTYTVPATGTNGVQVRLYNGSGTAGDVVHWDSLLVEQTPTLGTYFDGDIASTTADTYHWTGAAHSSTSTDLQYAGVGGIEAGVLGPSHKPVWMLSRTSNPVGWGTLIAADIFDDIPTGTQLQITCWMRFPAGETISPAILADPGTLSVATLPSITGTGNWQQYVATFTTVTDWVAGSQRFRAAVNTTLEWSDPTVQVVIPLSMKDAPAPAPEPEIRKYNRVFTVLR